MPNIDERLLDCESLPELTENFNRVLVVVDALEERVAALESPSEP